jgi:hypothetical protein
MIYINIGGKTPPEEWIEKAQTVTQQLDEAATKEERDGIIKKNSALWGELKQWLLDFSYNKCWYTEARNDSSYFEVEHFRPKKWITDTDNPDFDGYWWLAFDWTNYRVCGNSPNRKKGAFFPLRDGSQRASCEHRHLTEDELFALLDPIELDDPQLISFEEDGSCNSTPGCEGWEKERAEVSIERYGLNSLPQLCEGRQKIWQECRDILDELSDLHLQMQRTPTANCRARIKEKTKQLRAKLKPDQIFSATARECLNASGYNWAQKLASS